jgi:hypothetical protein
MFSVAIVTFTYVATNEILSVALINILKRIIFFQLIMFITYFSRSDARKVHLNKPIHVCLLLFSYGGRQTA